MHGALEIRMTQRARSIRARLSGKAPKPAPDDMETDFTAVAPLHERRLLEAGEAAKLVAGLRARVERLEARRRSEEGSFGARLSVKDIIELVCVEYTVSVTDLISARRTHDILLPRQVACYLARHHTFRSLPEIGRVIGGRDRTTIQNAIDVVSERMKFDAELSALIAKLAGEINAREVSREMEMNNGR